MTLLPMFYAQEPKIILMILSAYTYYKSNRINIFNCQAADGKGKELLFFKEGFI